MSTRASPQHVSQVSFHAKLLAKLSLYLAIAGGLCALSQAAFAGCASLEQMAQRMEGLTNGSPISVKSVRGNEYKGVVTNVFESPDGRRAITLLKPDGTTVNAFVDQFDPATFRGPFESIPPNAQITVTSASGNPYSGKYGGVSPSNPDEIFLTDRYGKVQTLKVRKLNESSLRVVDPVAPIAQAAPRALPATAPALRPATDLGFSPDTRVQIMSVNGNPRAGYIRGYNPDGSVAFLGDDGVLVPLNPQRVKWSETRALPTGDNPHGVPAAPQPLAQQPVAPVQPRLPVPARDHVGQIMADMTKPLLGADGTPFDLVKFEPDRVVPAVERALRDRVAEGQPLPKLPNPLTHKIPTDSDAFSQAWGRSADQNYAHVPSYTVPESEITAVRGGIRTAVRKVEIDGKQQYFRPVNEAKMAGTNQYDIVRRDMAANKFNAMLGLDTAPRGKLVRINGVLGSLDETAPGFEGSIIRSREIDPHVMSNAQGFEFLAGSGDIHATNYNVVKGSNGYRIQIFDHDSSFQVGIPMASKNLRIGGLLPEKYTPQFIHNLQNVTPADIRKYLGDLLSPDELEAVIFRREVLLNDFATRGAAATF